jgi:hypothetical protein
MLATFAMTLFLILFMFLVIMFVVCFDYMFSIARLSLCLCISLYSAHSKVHGVSGQHCVSMVLVHCLPMDTPYIPGHVVDHKCDILVETFVVQSPNVGQVGSSCKGSQAIFLIFLSNMPYV